MSDRWILLNAEIITMDPLFPRATALAVEGGRIVRVGSQQDMAGLIESGWKSIDAGGAAVLPGFIDTHEHMMLTGSTASGVPLADVTSMDQVLERVADAAGKLPKGEWIRGGNLNELTLTEKRMPTAAELDRIAPDHPVYLLHATCHLCSFNTRALEIVKLPLGLPGVDLAGGRPNGVVRDPGILTYVHPVMGRIMPAETKFGSLRKAAELALDKGVTTIHALDGGDLGPGDTEVICRYKDQLPVRVVCYNQSMDLSEVLRLELPRVGGCICADGAFEAHTAALFEPYFDEPDNYGALTYTREVMDHFIMDAHAAGLQIAVHCESEASIEQVLSAMEKAMRAIPRSDHRHRIEHFELPTPNQIDRMARAGITASMQPAFIPAFIGEKSMEIYESLLGPARLRWVHPYRTILDHGIPVCGGSDSPVTPNAPLVGVQAAVNHPNPAERITRMEALAMFTRTAAWSAFEENEKGMIKPGLLADLVLLDANPLTVAADRIRDISVKMVFVGGRKVRPA